MTLILTERLRLRRLQMADIPVIVAMDSDPEVMRFIPGGPAADPVARTKLLAERVARAGADEPLGLWAVEWLARPGALGWCGLLPLEGGPEIELAYRYAKAHWGQGIGSEAAAALVEHAFGTVGLERLVAVAIPANRASTRLLERVGMLLDGGGEFYGLPMSHYSLSRGRYLRQRSSPARADRAKLVRAANGT